MDLIMSAHIRPTNEAICTFATKLNVLPCQLYFSQIFPLDVNSFLTRWSEAVKHIREHANTMSCNNFHMIYSSEKAESMSQNSAVKGSQKRCAFVFWFICKTS